MTNDTSTLNGALTELGELMADNLVTMGVTDATASDGLTTLANKILDVPVTTQTLILTTDKTVLSYADSDTLTLTATLIGGIISGQTIEFYNGTTSMGTATTNSTGVATMTYSSSGVGDIVFSATKNSVSSNTVTIEDCIKTGFNNWNGTFTTGTDTYDYIQITGNGVGPNITLPSAFEMNYKFKNLTTDGAVTGTGLWVIGTDTDNGVLIGHEGADRRIRVYSRSNGSNTARDAQNYVYSFQTWTDAKITYENGTISMTVGGKSVSYNLSSAVIMQFYASYAYMRIAEWKIKPL